MEKKRNKCYRGSKENMSAVDKWMVAQVAQNDIYLCVLDVEGPTYYNINNTLSQKPEFQYTPKYTFKDNYYK